MKRRTGVWIVVAGVLLLIFTWNPMNIFSNVNFGFSFSTKEIHEEQAVSPEEIEKLDIRTGSGDIEVVQGSSDEIMIRLDGKVSKQIADQVKLKVESKGETLSVGIDAPDHIGFGVRIMDTDLTVELPEKMWAGADIEAGSGDIEIAGLQGEDISIKVGSGDIHIEDIDAVTIGLKSGSGDISAERYKASLMKFEAGSGSVDLQDGEAELQGEASSGNIQLEADELLQDADLRVGSGNVTVDLDQEPSSLTVDFKGGSGTGEVSWGGFQYEEKDKDKGVLRGTFGSGDVLLKVRTGSGDFTLE